MIRENQQLLNRLNVLSDGVLIYVMLPLAFWLRFYVLPGGVITVPLVNYLRLDVFFTLVQLFTFAAFGYYQTTRNVRLRDELSCLLRASLLDMLLLLGWLFIGHKEDYSRITLFLHFVFGVGTVGLKKIAMRKLLRSIRSQGKNLKNVLIIGGGKNAERYLSVILGDRSLGYHAVGYVAPKTAKGFGAPYLGTFEALEKVLERTRPDEVISAIDMRDYELTPHIIECCEQSGVKLSIIPFYADYMPANPQFDELSGVPLLNIRRIPLDNFANAFLKRTLDIVLSALGLLVLSPVLLICALGVKLSSPGPVLFRQQRVGRNKKRFNMYKFRSMRVNSEQDSAWSTQTDSRRTRFGSFIRKCSLDELPQLWNVLRGDMSLVGPRPEIPHFVDQFRGEIPLYMVRHQVRPGITGWAQVNGLRGDTPIKTRVEFDLYYIENWNIWFDLRILLATVFKGKFLNDEQLG